MSRLKPYFEYKESDVEWIGEIPRHWNVRPLFSVAGEVYRSNGGMIETNILSLSFGRVIRKPESENLGLVPESYETYQIVEPGEIIFRFTDLQNDKRSLRSAQVVERGIITSAYLAVTVNAADPTYFSLLMRAYDHCKVFYAMGGGLRQSLKYSDVRRLPVIIPTLTEQMQIVKHLERETTRIDALISKKTSFIGLLKEKRQAFITHAVTKGLDPNVKMKDTGVEWISEVPETWQAMKFNRVARVTEGLVDPKDPQYRDLILLAPNHIESGTGKIVALETAAEQNAESGKYTCKHGTVVYSKIRPALAKVTIAPCDCLCSADMYPLDCSEYVDPDWLFYLMLSLPFTAWAILESDRVAMPKINREALSTLKVFVPPKKEQQAQAQWLNAQLTRIDRLSEKTQRSIDLLKEHRSALITAAVTGKIDLRETV